MSDQSPKTLCKYVTAEGLINILETGKLKWSAPRTFNDPFDLALNPWKFCLEEYGEVLFKRVTEIIMGHKKPPSTTHQVLLTIRRLRINEPNATTEKVKRKINEYCSAHMQNGKTAHAQYAKKIQNSLGSARVLCLAERHSNLLMWAHYANSHEGAAIEFQCQGNFLGRVEKIIYQKDLPTKNFMPKLVDYAIGFTNSEPGGTQHLITKSCHWKYEQEYRLTRLAGDKSKNEEYHEFPAKDLVRIYLGCKVSEQNEEEILSLIKGDFKQVKVEKASTNQKEFKLDFNPI